MDLLQIMTTFAQSSWALLCEMAPYLLFGFFAAGVLSVFISPETIRRHLGGRGLGPIVKASVFGVPLPLCSCGVIPVGASLRRHGASRGATASFLLSTPQTGVDSILATWGLLGPVFAVFRPLAALATGLLGGGLVAVVSPNDKDPEAAPTRCEGACCAGKGEHGRAYRALHYGFVTLPRDIVKPLIVGLLVAGVISAVVPDDFFTGVLGTGLIAMFVMMAVGLPMYVCATASVPVAAALMAKGVPAGAAFVFLVVGPATNAATVSTVWHTLGGRAAAAYLGSTAGCALAGGFVLNAVYSRFAGALPAAHAHEMTPGAFGTAAAVTLIVLLLTALRGHDHAAHEAQETESDNGEANETRLEVRGMTCRHCADNVAQALRGCEGVASAHVNLKQGEAVVHGRVADRNRLVEAVRSLGYRAEISG